MNIGDKIKLVRRHRGLTQQQLGILIDIKKRGERTALHSTKPGTAHLKPKL